MPCGGAQCCGSKLLFAVRVLEHVRGQMVGCVLERRLAVVPVRHIATMQAFADRMATFAMDLPFARAFPRRAVT